MKMGDIQLDVDGDFVMKTPEGIRTVTLRCDTKGVVCVDEMSSGSPVRPFTITQQTQWENDLLELLKIHQMKDNT